MMSHRQIFRLLLGIMLFSVCISIKSSIPYSSDRVDRFTTSYRTLKQESVTAQQHLVVILIPGLSFDELGFMLDSFPQSMQQHLQIGGMSMRTGGSMNLTNNLITLATGHRETGLREWNSYQQDEWVDHVLAGDLYQQRSGRKAQGTIVHPAFYKLQQEWALRNGSSTAGPGWLGEWLAREQIYTYALGNSDIRESKHRLAATFVMNQRGEANGEIGDAILTDHPHFPTGRKTNWDKLSTDIRGLQKNHPSTLIVVELGDLERMASEKEYIEIDYYNQLLEEWFIEWGQFVAEISLDHPGNKHSLWILSPMVSNEAYKKGKHLLPLLTWSPNQSLSLLTSDTTRQSGLVSNLDLAPSILHFFGLKQPTELIGKTIRSEMVSEGTTSQTYKISSWLDQVGYIFAIYDKRRDIITIYVSMIIISLFLSTAYWWFNKHRGGSKIAQLLLGSIMLSPIYFLWLTPLIQYIHVWNWISALLLVSIATSLILFTLFDKIMYLTVIAACNMGVVLYDIWQGSDWMKRSFLGYDPLIGARYYGLGNEYAGVLLGSSILAVVGFYIWLREKEVFAESKGTRRKIIFLTISSGLYGCILFLIAAPQFGTNAGATMASLFTYAGSQLLLFQYRVTWKGALSIIVGLSAIFLGFVMLHVRGEQTHIGAVIHMVSLGEVQPVLEIIQRKWEMNLKLIRVSVWGKLFAASLLVLFLFLFRIKQKSNHMLRDDPWFNGFRSIVLGAVLILLVNDSGIVAAATTMMYVTFPFIFLRFADQQESTNHLSS